MGWHYWKMVFVEEWRSLKMYHWEQWTILVLPCIPFSLLPDHHTESCCAWLQTIHLRNCRLWKYEPEYIFPEVVYGSHLATIARNIMNKPPEVTVSYSTTGLWWHQNSYLVVTKYLSKHSCLGLNLFAEHGYRHLYALKAVMILIPTSGCCLLHLKTEWKVL